MDTVEGHEFISLKTPFEQTNLPEEKRAEYEALQSVANKKERSGGIPWFPFLFPKT